MSTTIHVERPFTLTLDGTSETDGKPATPSRTISIPAGIQTVDDFVANHWFTKAHLSNGGLGATPYAAAQRQQADQAFVKFKESGALWFQLEKATVDAEVAADLDLSSPAYDRLALPEPGDDPDANTPQALDLYREAAEKELQARRAAGDKSAPEAEPDEFDAMTDDQLREFITTRDGKAPNARTGRPKLLLAARGDKGAAADIENGGQA